MQREGGEDPVAACCLWCRRSQVRSRRRLLEGRSAFSIQVDSGRYSIGRSVYAGHSKQFGSDG